MGFASCEFPTTDQTITIYKNGQKEFTIILNDSRDTIEKRSYHKNGNLLAIIPYHKNNWNGIIREFDDRGRLINKRGFIDGRFIFMERHYFDTNNQDTVIKTYRRIDDRRSVAKDYLRLSSDSVVRLKSYGMKVFSSKDTISLSEMYNFTLNFYTMHRDSAFHEVLIGPIDVDMNLSDTILWESGWDREFTFSKKPSKLGYNYLFGKIKIVVIQPEIPNIGLDSTFFYTDFYVTE